MRPGGRETAQRRTVWATPGAFYVPAGFARSENQWAVFKCFDDMKGTAAGISAAVRGGRAAREGSAPCSAKGEPMGYLVGTV